MKVMVIKNIVFLGNVNVMFIKLIIVVYIYIICIKKMERSLWLIFFLFGKIFFFFLIEKVEWFIVVKFLIKVVKLKFVGNFCFFFNKFLII